MSKSIQFHLVFSQAWILSKREDDVLPVDWFLSAVKDRFDVRDVQSRISECYGTIELAATEECEKVLNELINLVADKYDIESGSDIFDIEIKEVEETPKKVEEKTAEQAPRSSKKVAEQSGGEKAVGKDPLKHIENLVGASEFKKLAAECASVAPYLIANKIVDSFSSRSYIISINDGYGLTTYLNAFADLISELHLFEFSSSFKTAETVLNPPGSSGGNNPFEAALSYFQGRGKGRVVCIDISEWMTKLTDKSFRNFLRYIDEHIGENIVFFRVPYVEQSVVRDIEKRLADILTVTTLVIPPFTNDELIQCAEAIMSERGYSVEKDAWEVFSVRIAAEKSDGRFYGINTIRKIIREMLYAKQLSNIKNGSDDKIIRKDDIKAITNDSSPNTLSGYEQLKELVGLDSLKGKIEEVVAQIEAAVSNDSLGSPCIHMRFVGNPGTGKTTVARIIGTILKEKGILRNGSFFEYSGRDLCGRFVGETAPKTAAICRDAYGSVLFIDEAYSLYRDDGISNVDYGREAIDTLVAEMENHRSDLMVIMAGYPDEMEKLMSGNVGLKSRMPYLIEFPNYTRDQLAEIFFAMAKKSFSYDSDFEEAVKTYFSSLSTILLSAKDFSNARFIRNLYERTWGKAALRCQMSGAECTSLTVEDFALATSDEEFQNIMEQKKRAIGFAN